MKAFVVFSAIFAVALAQQGRYVDPKNAAILAEARYLSGDGSFGSAYVQEDGVEFKEETAANGDRKGQYSYIDPDGKKITVQYTAGKNGFQVTGDHLPKAPQPQPQAAPQPQYQPAPQYNTQPQYNSIPQQQNYNSNSGDDGSYDASKYETPYQYSTNAVSQQQYAPAPQQQYAPAPQQQQQQYAPAPQQAQFQYNNNQQSGFPQQYQNQIPQTTTTPAPSRFFPPGKLNLNRTPDGYQYNFSSN